MTDKCIRLEILLVRNTTELNYDIQRLLNDVGQANVTNFVGVHDVSSNLANHNLDGIYDEIIETIEKQMNKTNAMLNGDTTVKDPCVLYTP